MEENKKDEQEVVANELPPGMKEAIAKYRLQMQAWVLEKRNTHFPLERMKDGSLRWINRAERRARGLK